VRKLHRLITAAALIALTTATRADVCNIKVVTDANPDYSDIGSFIHSSTSNWKEDRDKCWAVFYWNHIGRRQTWPMCVHGQTVTDPICQFNDYGYTMCSTISGINCAIFGAMGLPVRYWDIGLHTVMDVEFDGKYHMIDDSMSALYTLCDGKTLASVDEIGQEGACAASGGKVEPGHIAKYHCLYATSPNGFLTGADVRRSLESEAYCFDPTFLKYRHYYNNWDLGHRYSLNLRDHEVYTRYYHRLDEGSTNAVAQPKADKDYRADPAYFTPNPFDEVGGGDPESVNRAYHIRGNGVRTYVPELSEAGLTREAWSLDGVRVTAGGVAPKATGTPGSVIFSVEGANVLTSLKIAATLVRKTDNDRAAIAISVNNGQTWKEVYTADKTGEQQADVKLIPEVNGSYEVLVKVSLLGKGAPVDAALKSLRFEAITQINSKTQPRLRLGKNTVYVGTGAPSQSIVLCPGLVGEAWKANVVDSHNVATYRDPKTQAAQHPGYMAVMFAEKANEEAYIVFKIDAPGDLTGLTYGGRYYNAAAQAHVDTLHSFDNGKTWTNSYSLTDTSAPWDVIHYEKAKTIPKGVRSVLVKYVWNAKNAGCAACGLYSVRMEANYQPVDAAFKPLEVAFAWKEVQKDYTSVMRSHIQKVDKVPCTYVINVGGEDHPAMGSLRVNLVGAQPAPATYGYSDGKDVGGEKVRDRWMTVGKVLSTGKPYTASVKSKESWGAGDPDGRKLTDGVVGSCYSGSSSPTDGVLYTPGTKPEITVDLGSPQKCGAFRIQAISGWPFLDALQGQKKDKVEVLTSLDGQAFTSRGFFDFNLRRKDIPVNFMVPDNESLTGYNFPLILAAPVEARYIRFKIDPAHMLGISEVQALDGIAYAPFDLKIALPDGHDRSDVTAYPLRHDPSKEFKRSRKRMGPDGSTFLGDLP